MPLAGQFLHDAHPTPWYAQILEKPDHQPLAPPIRQTILEESEQFPERARRIGQRPVGCLIAQKNR